MIIGERLRRIREHKGLTQADVEKRTGLMKCYISRVENGRTVPSLENIERFASALETPLYRIFYSAENVSQRSTPNPEPHSEPTAPVHTEADDTFLSTLRGLLDRIAEQDRGVLLAVAQHMASRCQ